MNKTIKSGVLKMLFCMISKFKEKQQEKDAEFKQKQDCLRVVLDFLACLVMNAAHSYILLTANLDDVHTIAKQLSASPVADQLQSIWRRASTLFNRQIAKSKIYERADDELESKSSENPSQNEQSDQEWNAQQNDNDLVESRRLRDVAELGKNASFYLTSIQKIMETM